MAQNESEYSPLYRSWRTLVNATGDNGRKGLKDAGGNWVLAPRFEDARPFLNHKLPADTVLSVFLRPRQDPAAPAEYTFVGFTGVASFMINMPALPVMIDGQWHVFFFRIDGSYYDYGPFPEGLIPCGDDWGVAPSGYINPDGEWAIERRFAHVEQFSEGLALVGVREPGGSAGGNVFWRQQLLYGYINTSGGMVIAPAVSLDARHVQRRAGPCFYSVRGGEARRFRVHQPRGGADHTAPLRDGRKVLPGSGLCAVS
jgi:hypothetical protein